MSSPFHDSAHLHVTGKSEYIDDKQSLPGEVHVGIYFSPVAHAEILNLDFSKAKQHPDFVEAFCAKDIHHNLWGTIFADQPLLAEKIINYAGEPIAVFASKNRHSLLAIKKLIQLKYKKLEPILSIDNARKKNCFIGEQREILRGEIDLSLTQSKYKISGEVVIEGAEHFYLESQAAIVYPMEDGQLEVHSSSQHPTETQHVVAHCLGLSEKDVVCIVKRMGGGFGGKESQAAPIAALAALVAFKLKKPARLVLNKDDDMIITGKRNPFQNYYQVGFDAKGKINVLDVQLFSDGGAYADLSTAIMERAMLHIDNAYFIPNLRVRGQVCRTHFHPHTAFRGFGGPKGVATIEHIIEKIAQTLDLDSFDIRKINLYDPKKNENTTHYGQFVDNNCLPELMEKLAHKADYFQRRKILKEKNTEDDSLYGLSMTPVKFGISFTTRFLNQGNALVLIHRDGTLQVSTGATEMGQGVNIRIGQLIADELGVDIQTIRLMPTRTDKNANTSPTAASSGTDINGSAAILAIRKIKVRLSELALRLFAIEKNDWPSKTAALGIQKEIDIFSQEIVDHLGDKKNYAGVVFDKNYVYLENNPKVKIKFKDLVNEAYLTRISLSEYAHFKIPNLSFNKLTGKGHAFLYFTQGVATSEVKINKWTGEVKILRSDILMDLGRPINEALDKGQVAGAFIQGMGWVTNEKLFYNQDGFLLTHSPSTYKIPSIQDTPRIFNIDLLSNEGNQKNLRGTKAVGEPPLLLALSVWTAIMDALKTSELPIPATQERILRILHPNTFEKYQENFK